MLHRLVRAGFITLVFALMAAEPSRAAGTKPPNLIFIIADDMFRDMLNCTPEGKGRNLTPNLDRLAAEGVVMQGQHTVSPVCTPSRYNCLTGRYASRARKAAFTQMTERGGMSLVVWNTMLLPDDVTLPGLLQKAGYTTGTVGKHHCIQWPKLEPTSPTEDARDPAVAAKLESNVRKMEAALRALGFDFVTNIIRGNLDFAPTILDLAGVEQPKDFFDGRSFRAVLEGKAARVHDAPFFEQLSKHPVHPFATLHTIQ